MFGRSTSSFDRLLEKATSQILLEPDWTSNLMICDSIRQGDVNPKYAVTAIKKKFYHQNPHAALFALQVMETCVKNCGDLVHQEIATKTFMEEMRELVKQAPDDNIKNKVLELIQTWGTVFRNSPKYRIVTDTLNLMKAEGWKFPPIREADAMFEADTAPEWAEGDVCRRCRVQFSTFTRQHHCRACGQVFCGRCSSKSCLLPKFGIEREVRVCDACFDKYGPKDEAVGDSPQHQPKPQQLPPLSSSAAMKDTSSLPQEYLSSPLSKQPQQAPVKQQQPGKSEAELKEEEELQLVLALSMSEAEEKEKMKKKQTNDMIASLENNKTKVTNGARTPPEESSDPELAKYLNRDYWEAKKDEVKLDPTLPSGVAQAKQNLAASTARVQEAVQGSGQSGRQTAGEAELEDFTTSLRTQLEIFVNRMKSNSSRGRPIANDSSVQSLFVNMMTLHSKLVKYIQEQEDARLHYEGLQDKLTQVRDARAALDALREEERERRRREAEEAERQRQIQMAYKLEQMRKKKAEYLEYQRQMALKRMADQEREMAMMKDASRKNYMTQQQNMYSMYLPYGQPGMYPPNMQPPTYAQAMGSAQPGMISAIPGQPGMQPPQFGQQGGMMVPAAGQEGAPDQQQGGYQFYPQPQPGFGEENFNMQGMAGALPQVPGVDGSTGPAVQTSSTGQTVIQNTGQAYTGQPGVGQSEASGQVSAPGQVAAPAGSLVISQSGPAPGMQQPNMQQGGNMMASQQPQQPGMAPVGQVSHPGMVQPGTGGQIAQQPGMAGVSGLQPGMTAAGMAGGNMQPAGGNMQPAGGNMQPVGGNMQPAGGNMQPAGGNMQPAGGNMQPAGGPQVAQNVAGGPQDEDSLIVF